MTGGLPSVDVSNVLSEEKKQQVIALGRLGWSLRRIERADRHPPRDRRGISESGGDRGAATAAVGTRMPAKPAIEVTTDFGAEFDRPISWPRSAAASPVAAHRPAPASPTGSHRAGLSRGRNAMAIWQDLVDDHGFTRRLSQRQALRAQAARAAARRKPAR